MIFFRYTRFLEGENTYLKSRVEALEQRNQELVLFLAQKSPVIPISQVKPEKKHILSKSDTSASCSCGWKTYSDDPGILQQEIASHYRKGAPQAKKKSWPEIKAALESSGEENAS